jgi:hypothetical protein
LRLVRERGPPARFLLRSFSSLVRRAWKVYVSHHVHLSYDLYNAYHTSSLFDCFALTALWLVLASLWTVSSFGLGMPDATEGLSE